MPTPRKPPEGDRDQIEGNLRKLHRRGLAEQRVDDLDALTAVAHLLSSKPTDVGKIEEALTQAISGYGKRQSDVVRLWFGLEVDEPEAPETRTMSSTERHNTAWKRWGEGTEDSFRTHFAKQTYEFLSKRLVELGEAAVATSDATTANVDPALFARVRAFTRSHVIAALVGAGMTLLVVGMVVLLFRSLGTGRPPSVILTGPVPPHGAIVNAQSGRISFNKPVGASPGLYEPGVVLGAGLRGCNLSAGLPCDNPNPLAAIGARRGDHLEFEILLDSEWKTPLPYLEVSASWSPGKTAAELRMAANFAWPRLHSDSQSGEAGVARINLVSPGEYRLVYIPGSTVLTTYNEEPLYRLPDTVMTTGVGLADLGPPSRCLELGCGLTYDRVVRFEVRVEETMRNQ